MAAKHCERLDEGAASLAFIVWQPEWECSVLKTLGKLKQGGIDNG